MVQDSILLDKSLKFAARIVKLHKYLVEEKHESIISKQIIRFATSIMIVVCRNAKKRFDKPLFKWLWQN